MSNRYSINAYKHFWISDDDLIPQVKDERTIVVEAESEEEAIKAAEREYGSAQRIEGGRYVHNPDGSWTIMEVTGFEILRR